MSKNTGKTVVLNHLLAAAAAHRVDVGLTSIGRDGEEHDAVFSIPKPPVVVWPGMVVATARDTLLRAKVRTRMLAATGVLSPMGEVVLVKVMEAGEMEVAGASRSQDQHRVLAQLRQCGASLVLIDGALGRSHHASPAMADGVVLATGAALGGAQADVLRKTRERLALLGIPAVDAESHHLLGDFFNRSGVGLWSHHGHLLWHTDSASLNAGPALLEQAASCAQLLGMVAFTGAVGQRLWAALETLAQQNPGLRVVVGDGTRLFVEAADLANLAASGARLMAWRRIVMAGITTNPFSPMGGHLDAALLLKGARNAFPEYVVSDVVLDAQHALQ